MTELPTTFGKYYLTDKLATGGMAEIFLAKLIGPAGFEKQLVIKQIHPALSGQRHFVDLFVAEAKTLVGLTHGNIVPVYELGVVDDTYFIAMEYIDGPTLYQLSEARFAAGGAFAPPLAGWLVAEIARGLDYAHRKGAGVVHRDLSPRNVMLSRDGEVKIVDFGIAVDPGAADAPAGDHDRMPTGSFAYMSPEQVARRPLTGQSDLFSLGVLAWEMLVGERLFARATPEETLAAVREGPIAPPSSRRPEVPARLDAVVLRALERDPARRWGSAADLLSALQRYLFGLTNAPGPREVAALVAASCPPAGRRARSEPADGPVTATLPEPDAGPTTRPVARDAGPTTRPVGERTRRRPPSVRQATFATHVDLARALGQTPPSEPPATDASRPEEPPAADAPHAEEPAATAPPAIAPPIDAPRPPAASRRRAIALAALAATLATLATALLRPCAGRDDRRGAVSAIGDAGTGPPVDASAATVLDAATAAVPDAAAIVADDVDAGPPARPLDAGLRRPADARPAAATGTLKVGADPWGDVFLDGRRLGRAPGAWPVAAGRHVVEVVFPSDQGELRRRFPIDVAAAGEARVFADFRAAGSGAP